MTSWTSAKFWHQHMVSQTYLAIGKHIKVYDWPLTKTDVGKRTDKGWRRILKPLYQSTNCSEKICLIIIPTSSRICLKQRKHSEVQQARNTGFWKRRYTKENSSSSLHTQWAIDQGATRLGVIEFECMLKDGGSPFSQGFIQCWNMDETLNPSSLS